MIDDARRATTSRRELARSPAFEEISPDVGELDEAALNELLADDPDQTMSLLADLTRATDSRLRDAAKELASRLFLGVARTQRVDGRGIGRVVSRPWRDDGGDVDVDSSLDELVGAGAERRAVERDRLRALTWRHPSTAWCLVVDRSGSMQGEPLATAAMASAAIAVRADGEFAVLSFARDVIAVKAMWEERSADDVVDRTLALRGRGTTDVAGALRAAAAQLEMSSAVRRVTVLLSDCRATTPGDVLGAARLADELVIVAPAGDDAEARALAGETGARWASVSGPSDVVRALSEVLDS